MRYIAHAGGALRSPVAAAIGLGLCLLAASPARAATIGSFDFDDPGAANGVVAAGSGSVLDSSPNPLHGDPLNGPVYSSDVAGGGGGTSLDFHPVIPGQPVTDRTVRLPGSANGKYDITGALEIDAWVKLLSGVTAETYVAGKWGTSGNGTAGYLLWVYQGNVTFSISQDGWNRADLTGPALPVGQWVHLEGVFDPTAPEATRLRLDFTPEGGATTTTFLSTSFTSIMDNGIEFEIGNGSGGGRAFHGLIDDLRVSAGGVDVPEPGALAVMVIAGGALLARARREGP